MASLHERHFPDGSSDVLGEFPPRHTQFNWQATIYHAGLRFFELEFADSLFGEPNDWGLCRRWLRAGVRIGFLDEITADLYPSASGLRSLNYPLLGPEALGVEEGT